MVPCVTHQSFPSTSLQLGRETSTITPAQVASASLRVKLSWRWKPVGIPQSPGNLEGLAHKLVFRPVVGM